MIQRRIVLLAVVSLSLAFAQAPAASGPSILAVTGDLPMPLMLKVEDLAAMPREKAMIPEQDGTQVEYEGVPLREILKLAGAPVGKDLRGKALASYVLA